MKKEIVYNETCLYMNILYKKTLLTALEANTESKVGISQGCMALVTN
jgi:hypothetical protein